MLCSCVLAKCLHLRKVRRTLDAMNDLRLGFEGAGAQEFVDFSGCPE